MQEVHLWIWQYQNWTNFSWDNEKVQSQLRSAWKLIGELIGQTRNLTQQEQHITLDTILNNILSSSAIEGEMLNAYSVRSSLAKRLGIFLESPYPTSDRSEGVSEIMLDALENWQSELSLERLFQWHQWLFAHEHANYIGKLRGEEPMQVVSGRLDRPTVHFEAPPRTQLEQELNIFIQWFNQSRSNTNLDPLIRVAICHLWLLTLHPFEDGNGRITRTLTDLALAQADQQSIRLYAISATILKKKNDYYRILEQSQKGTPNIQLWIEWFLDILIETLQQSLKNIHSIIQKARFWQFHQNTEISAEQKKVLNRLLDGGETGFENGINASQYQKVAKVSKATATRHLSYLLEKGLLQKTDAGGRSTRYVISSYP
ncbi:cell filamentation protein Fic [Pasteurellaceae bacterium 15-036681]|nr:cell filamentation protein Fic [Pasteurellaceae bacterium 15-036681]